MCAVMKDFKMFQAGGLDYDSAVEVRAKNDYFPAFNIRPQGVAGLDEGYIANIESNQLLSASVAPGISRCIGSAGFESARFGVGIYFNSAGYNQIRKVDYDTDTVTTIDISAWPLSPQNYVNDIKLVNNEFLLMNDGHNPPFYVNLPALEAGDYGETTATDFMLAKPQPWYPASASYSDDASRAVNLLNTKLFRFRTQFIGLYNEPSIDGVISPLFIPEEQSTPRVGTDVTKNNNLIIKVDAGTDRVKTLVLDGQYGVTDWFTVRTIDRADILALPLNIDIPTQVYEAYDPATNLYTFVFYNDGLYVNKPVLETDQQYSNVPITAGALEILNGNQVVFGDITTGYYKPVIDVSLSATNYNPNLSLPFTDSSPLRQLIVNPGQSGSGLGNHKRLVQIEFTGVVQQGDILTIVMVDIRNAGNTLTYVFPCDFAESGDTALFITNLAPEIASTSVYTPTDGFTIGLNIVTQPFFTLQSSTITLFNPGSTVFKSIHALKLNSSYQLAFAGYDYFGRPFPIVTDASWILKTNSYGQSHGATPQFNWKINTPTAPEGMYTYQWLISQNNTHLQDLYMLASIIAYEGTWDATANTPTLAANTGTTGFVYKITGPGSQNLGMGETAYMTNDYVLYNGSAWTVIPGSYGDLSDTTAYYFYLNSLQAFNARNNTSILNYDYTVNDRCTLAYYDDAGNINYFDGVVNPIVDVAVLGYDASVFFLKVNKASGFDSSTIVGKNVMLELYTPKSVQSSPEAQVFYETGVVYKVIDGQYETLQGVITDGDAYFKTRQIPGSIDPNTTYSTVVEDFNFSDFYPSRYTSYGRPRIIDDVLGRIRKIANIIYSQQYIVGSKNNGLPVFYVADVYGEAGGQTSSSYGAIVKLIQINNELIDLQELNHGSIPVFINIIEDQIEQQNVAISEKILGNIRYTYSIHIGVGVAKESIAVYNNIIYWIDSNRSEPIRWNSANGAIPINEKMSKYFRQVLAAAYAAGLKVIGYYDIFNDEYVIAIQREDGTVHAFGFNDTNWQYRLQFSVLPGEITITTNPLHSSPSYNNVTGIVVITPSVNYVGSDSFQFSFGNTHSPSTRNLCYNWISGSGIVYDFYFNEVSGAPQSTEIASNTISVGGNDYAVPISIVGTSSPEYSVNGGAWTNASGTVNAGDIVQVRLISAGAPSSIETATLTIDSKSAEFDVVTGTVDNFVVAPGNYGISIRGVNDVTTTGVPPSLSTINVAPGNTLNTAYTAVTAGQIHVNISGTPVIPGHVRIYTSVGGVPFDNANLVTGQTIYSLNLPSASDPTQIKIGTETF